jgi:hypothetical protein
VRLTRGKGMPRNEPQERYHGLSEAEFNALARYNQECSNGIKHTPQWRRMMTELQSIWDNYLPRNGHETAGS